MIFYFRVNKLVHLMLPVIFLTLLLNSSGAKKIGENIFKNSTIPHCSLELFNYSNNSEKTLYRVTLTGSTGPKIKCKHRKYTNASMSVTCKGGRILVETGLSSSQIFDRVRLGCFDRHPLQYDQVHALPFAGIVSDFRKHILKDGAVQHRVSVTFPKIHLDDEGLEVYSGIYKFSREEPKWGAHFELNFSSVNHNRADTVEKKDMCIKVFNERADCEVGHSKSDVYFVNVGGKNPTETRLMKPCLNSSMQNNCGNKFPGTNCVQSRYCKKINYIHGHGLVRCTADNVTNDVEYFRDIFADIHTNMSEMWDHSLIIRIEEDNNDTRLEIEYEEDPDPSLENTNNYSACPQMTSILRVKPQENLTFYNEEFYNLECHFIPYFLVTPVLWFAGWNDGSKTQLSVDYGGRISKETKYFVNDPMEEVTVKIESSKLKFQALRGMSYISCEMWYWNSSGVAKNVQEVHVKESQSPVFSLDQEFRNVESGDTLTLECEEPTARPAPNYRWMFKGQERGQGSVLSITNIGTSGSGEYSCIASNFKGRDSKVFQVTVNGAEGSLSLATVLGSFVVVLSLLFVLLLAIYSELRKSRANLSTAEINEFINGYDARVDQTDEYVNARHMAYNKEYELESTQFEISEFELGSGSHGVVYEGTLGGLPVAVKSVRNGVEKQVLLALLDELKIMIYLGKHDHIVDLKGACTQFLEQGRVYVFLELCKLGSLESFLRKNRGNFCPDVSGYYVNVDSGRTRRASTTSNHQEFTTQNLLQWSTQIAKGMCYLEAKKVIHGDLAARNVLMESIGHIKITDFGLSKQLINTDTYVKRQKAMLPWRHMAIEAMREFRFTSKSDVWSYGVTVWEIFALGSTPYPGMNWTLEFLQFLEDNMRLYKPKYASDAIYKILTKCWEPEPESRPSFSELETLMAMGE